MAALDLRQIENRLNAEFTGDTRKLIFWYDDTGDFAEDIDSLMLTGAKVYRLQPDNQFYTKFFLERVDTTTSYLIYAPFPKPDIEDNHLEDTLLYSKRFFADRTVLLCADLGIKDEYRWLFEKSVNCLPKGNLPSGFAAWRLTPITRRPYRPDCSALLVRPAPAPSTRWYLPF